jgi:hypothetical protein
VSGSFHSSLLPFGFAQDRADFGQEDRVKKVSCLISSSGAVPSPAHRRFVNVIGHFICAPASGWHVAGVGTRFGV